MQHYPERPYQPKLRNEETLQQEPYYRQDYNAYRENHPSKEQFSNFKPDNYYRYQSSNDNRNRNEQYEYHQKGVPVSYQNNRQSWSGNNKLLHPPNQGHTSEFYENEAFHSSNQPINHRSNQSHFNEGQYAQHGYIRDPRSSEQPMENIQRRIDHVQVTDYQQPQYDDPRRHGYNREATPDLGYHEPQPDHSYNNSYSDSGISGRRLESKSTYAPNNASNEPMHLHQIGKPQVLAKTSGDGDAVAVFGVVAQVEKSPTSNHSHAFQQTPPSGPKQPAQEVSSPSYDSTNRAHNLTPIMEQPSSPPKSYNRQDPNYTDQHEFSRGRFDQRNPMSAYRPDLNENSRRSRFSGEFDRSRDLYRDEYTDSSGYGSTLTERSYEGPGRSQGPYRSDNKAPYSDQRSDRFPSQHQYQQPQSFVQNDQENYQRNQFSILQPNQNFARQDNFNDVSSRMDRNAQNQMENIPDSRRNEREYQRNQDYSNIDARQIKSVHAVKKMFDKPGSAPLPPVSASYGANQYSNARPLPPRPRIPSDENRYRQTATSHSNQNYLLQQPQQIRNESFQSYNDVHRPTQEPHFAAQISKPYERHKRNQIEEPHSYQQPRSNYSEPISHPVRTNVQYDEIPNKPSLPHYEPPPEHSQSMNNIDDLRPREVGNQAPIESRSRRSYTNQQENDMVVGVRFDKGNSSRPKAKENPSNVNESYAPSYQSDSRPNAGNENTNVQVQRFPASKPPPEQSIPPETQPNYNHHEERFEREQRTNEHNQHRSSAYIPEQSLHYNESKFSDGPGRHRSRSPQSPQFAQEEYPRQQDSRSQSKVFETSRDRHFPRQEQRQEDSRSQSQTFESSRDDYYPRQEQRQDSRSQSQTFESSRNHRYPREEQRQEDSRSHSQVFDSSRDHQGYAREVEQSQNHSDDNYVPDVVRRSYRLHSQSSASNLRLQGSEEWPEPPNDVPNQPYQTNVRKTEEVHVRIKQAEVIQGQQSQPRQDHQPSSYPQVETRQSPAGGDGERSVRQIPRHPFDPDDDSSEEVDVDAPTPPPSNRSRNQRPNGFYNANEQNWAQRPGKSSAMNHDDHPQQRSAPTGERRHQHSRQPGDGLNEDQRTTKQTAYTQGFNNTRPIAPKKPFRNSLKQKEPFQANEPEQLPDQEVAPLNHDHSKEKARLAQASKITKKPPNRDRSSTMPGEVPEENSNSDYEINVTSNDLARSKTSQPITVHQSATQSKSKQHKEPKHSPRSHVESLNEATQTDPPPTTSNQGAKSTSQKKTKLIFKPPPENALKKDARLPLPSIKEPAEQDRKMPPTYTDLLGQFTSHRVTALRSAAQKHDKALKTAQAAMHVDDQSDASRLSKRDENRQIYNQSKPHYSSRDDYSRRDRNRSSGRSADHRGSSRDRLTSPERRDRELDREHRSRKSDRDKSHHRPVSPHRGRNEDPYHHSPHHRRDEAPTRHRDGEPEWVEQYRKKRAGNEHQTKRKDWADDPRRRQRKEFDFDQYQRDVKKATSYNSDFEQPVRKQLFPTKLMAKGHSKPSQRPPQGNADWMKNLKEHNRVANRNRKYEHGTMTQNQGIAKAFCAQRFNDQAHGLLQENLLFPN